MILQNEIECLKCGDRVHSAHRHDFKYCKCGLVAVDGGLDYLKRVGNPEDYTDCSILMPDDLAVACMGEIDKAIDRGCNSLGILCAIMRTQRDMNYLTKGVSDV